MKKGFILLGMSMLLLLGSSRLQAQQISLSTPNTPATPIGICQCDTLDQTSTREISFVFSSNFLPSTTFHYELASPNNNWATADTLDIVSFRTNPVTNPVDTILSTNTKLVTLAIPCNAPLGPASLRIRSSNSEISDTLYYIINKIPYNYWKIITRKGGQIKTHNAKDFDLGASSHERFLNLINLPQYKRGIESLT